MKKIILLALVMILVASCSYNDKINGIQLNKGDTMTFETKDYIIIYEISRFNGLKEPIWEFKEIINKRDSL